MGELMANQGDDQGRQTIPEGKYRIEARYRKGILYAYTSPAEGAGQVYYGHDDDVDDQYHQEECQDLRQHPHEAPETTVLAYAIHRLYPEMGVDLDGGTVLLHPILLRIGTFPCEIPHRDIDDGKDDEDPQRQTHSICPP